MEVLHTLVRIIPGSPENILEFIAIFVRISILAFMLPGLGETTISPRIRLILALLVCWLIFPLVSSVHARPSDVADLVILMAREAFTGFFIGFAFRILVFALQIAGNIISQSLSLSQVFGGGMTTEPNTTISTLLLIGGVTFLVTLNLHVKMIGLLLKSYESFPLGHGLDTETTAYWIMQKSISAFSLGVSMALPFVVLNFIYNLVLGFVNKTMPQLMVSLVGMPFITGVGILLLSLSITTMLGVWVKVYMRTISGVF